MQHTLNACTFSRYNGILIVPRYYFRNFTPRGTFAITYREEKMQAQPKPNVLSAIDKSLSAAEEDSLAVKLPTPGIVLLTGETALDLIDRMSTNDLQHLNIGNFTPTVLTNPNARIIDLIWVSLSERGVLVLTSPNKEQDVRNWLKSHIFFQDDVQFADWPHGWTSWGIYGPKAQERLSALFPKIEPISSTYTYAEKDAYMWFTDEPVNGIRLLLDHEKSEQAQDLWSDNSAEDAAILAFELLRMEAGIPASPSEINAEYIPLEVGLWNAVSFSKGCYTGQEIIARMESRERVARQLAAVHLEDFAPQGSKIRLESRSIGELTSIAHSPRSGWIGLAVVRSKAIDSGNLQCEIGEGAIPGNISALAGVRHLPWALSESTPA